MGRAAGWGWRSVRQLDQRQRGVSDVITALSSHQGHPSVPARGAGAARNQPQLRQLPTQRTGRHIARYLRHDTSQSAAPASKERHVFSFRQPPPPAAARTPHSQPSRFLLDACPGTGWGSRAYERSVFYAVTMSSLYRQEQLGCPDAAMTVGTRTWATRYTRLTRKELIHAGKTRHVGRINGHLTRLDYSAYLRRPHASISALIRQYGIWNTIRVTPT